MPWKLMILAVFCLTAACASTSQRSLAERFIDFGLSADRADCLADELIDRLDGDDLRDVVDFMDGVNGAGSAGEALDALLRIDNPAAASAIARAGISCAF